MVLLTARFVPASCTPVAVFVFTVPFSVVVPEPAVCDRLAARTLPSNVTSFAETMLTEPSRLVAPTELLKLTFPCPAVIENVSPVTRPSALTVFVKTTLPSLALTVPPVVSIAMLPTSVVAPLNRTSPSTAEMFVEPELFPNAMAVAVMFTPSTAVVVTLLVNAVAPEPADCTRLAAAIVLLAVTS